MAAAKKTTHRGEGRRRTRGTAGPASIRREYTRLLIKCASSRHLAVSCSTIGADRGTARFSAAGEVPARNSALRRFCQRPSQHCERFGEVCAQQSLCWKRYRFHKPFPWKAPGMVENRTSETEYRWAPCEKLRSYLSELASADHGDRHEKQPEPIDFTVTTS